MTSSGQNGSNQGHERKRGRKPYSVALGTGGEDLFGRPRTPVKNKEDKPPEKDKASTPTAR